MKVFGIRWYAVLCILIPGLITSIAVTSRAEAQDQPPGDENPAQYFPTPVPVEEIGWLPPLYDFPLALSPHDHFYFIRPIEEIGLTWPLPDYRYGYYFSDLGNVHTGIDLQAPLRHPVVAAADGKVVFAGYGLLEGASSPDDPYGIAVMLRHDFGFDGYTLYTVYAHLEKPLVRSGQWVKAGDDIGLIGMTGMTSGPHLHFEVRLKSQDDERIQNPELWLLPPVGYGVLSGRVMNDYGTLLGSKEIYLKSLETGKKWTIVTYSPKLYEKKKANDPFYEENYVFYDLPQGKYEISTWYYYKYYQATVEIIPGAVNNVNFDGRWGFIQKTPLLDTSTDFLN